MPIHLAPCSRREFLVRGSAAVASLAVLRSSFAAERTDASSFALLADTHIPERPDIEARDVNMTANLKQVISQLRQLDPKPAGVIINGDCAYLKGLPADYTNLAQCIEPLAEADLPLHLTMGNHDDRGPFYDALAAQRPADPPLQSKHVSVIETPNANLFLLDSLREVNVVTGELGEQQRNWLARALDRRSDKPAVVIAHHNPQFEAPPEGTPWSGLKDSVEFFELLAAKKQVKAYIFGHTHNWSLSQHEGIHLINLPPVAYVFGAGKPNGWVNAQLHPEGIDLQLMTLDAQHPQAGQLAHLTWR